MCKAVAAADRALPPSPGDACSEYDESGCACECSPDTPALCEPAPDLPYWLCAGEPQPPATAFGADDPYCPYPP